MWNKVPKREYIRGNGYAPKKNPDKIINKGVIYDPMGQWKYPGEVTKIPGNTMATHGYGNIPLWVVPDNDPARLVQPNSGQQVFPNSTNFTEYPQLPIAQTGGVLLPGAQGKWLDSVNAQFNRQYGGDPSIPDLNQMKKGGWLEGYSKQTKLRGERGYTSKNIKTSINKLMLRNETLFGPKGKKIYDPLSKFQEGGWEQSINKFLGDPMSKAAKAADYKRPVVDPRTRRQHEAEPVDNVRHASAGRYTAEAIRDYAKLIPFLNNIPGLAEAAGFVGSNALGLGHEISSLYNDNEFDTRPWGLKLKETAADAYNNMVGSGIGLSNLSPYEKEAYIKYLSETGKIPTGQYNKKKDPTYKKQMGGEGWLEQYQVAGQVPRIDPSLIGQPNFASESIRIPERLKEDPFLKAKRIADYNNKKNAEKKALAEKYYNERKNQKMMGVKGTPEELDKINKDVAEYSASNTVDNSRIPLSERVGDFATNMALDLVGTGAYTSLGKAARALAKEEQVASGLSKFNLIKKSSSMPQSISELSNTGFRNDPLYHLNAFNDKKKNILEHISTPEGRKRIQAYIDNNPHLENKTVDGVIDNFNKTEFVTETPQWEKTIDKDGNWIGGDWIKDTQGNNIFFPVDPDNAFNWYINGTDKPSWVSMGQNYTPYDAQHILEHEFGHLFQGGNEIKGVDDELANISLKQLNPTLFNMDKLKKYNPFKKTYKDEGLSVTKDIYGYNEPFNTGLQNQKEYWKTGAGRGQEKAAFAAEVRENLLQRGLIKNRYDEITPALLKKHFDLYHDTMGDKYNLRLYDIMDKNPKNFKYLSTALNKLPGLMLPTAVGAAALNQKKLGGQNNWLEQYQDGGEEFFKSLPKTDPNRRELTKDDYDRATVYEAKKSLIDKGITHNWEQAPGFGYTVPEHPINSNKVIKQQDGGSTYKIKAGDSLSKIAKKYQTTVAELQKINKIKKANLIIAGKSLIIPKPPSVDKKLIPPVNNPTDVIRPTTNQKLDEQLPLTPVGVIPGVKTEEQKSFYNVPADTFKPDTVYSSYIKQETGNKDIPYVYTLSSSIPELTEPTYAGSHTDDKWGTDNLGINTEGKIEKLKIEARTQGPNIYRESGDRCIGADGSTVTECTSGMQLALDYNTAVKGEDRKKLGITGDAWEIGENIVEAGGNRYYNLTDIDFDRSKLKTNKDVKNYLDSNKKKLKLNNKAIAEQAEVGDIVEMWYQGSPSQDKALNRGKGKTVTTHAGIITEKDGKKYVSHNVHGVWHSDPLEKSLDKHRLHHGGSSIMIAGLIRPDYSDNKTALETTGIQVNPNAKFYSKEDESSYRNTKETKWKTETPVGKISQEFNKGLAYYAPKVQQDFGLTDKETEQLMKLTFGLFGKESGFGKGEKYVNKEKRRKFIKAYKDVAPDWAPEGDEMSAGKTQIKVDTVFDTPEKKALLAKYGITKDNIWDTENSAAAGLLSAAINYKKFKDFSGATYDNMDPLTLQNILALAHNKGMDAVIKNEFTERDKRTVGEKVGKLLKGQSDWNNKWDVEPYANIETKLKGFDTYSKLHLDSGSYSNLVADYAASLNVDYNKIKLIHEDPNNFVTRTDINPNTIIDDQIEADIKKVRYVQGAIDDKVDKAKSYVRKGKKVLKKGVRKTRQLVQHPKAWLNKYI